MRGLLPASLLACCVAHLMASSMTFGCTAPGARCGSSDPEAAACCGNRFATHTVACHTHWRPRTRTCTPCHTRARTHRVTRKTVSSMAGRQITQRTMRKTHHMRTRTRQRGRRLRVSSAPAAHATCRLIAGGQARRPGRKSTPASWRRRRRRPAARTSARRAAPTSTAAPIHAATPSAAARASATASRHRPPPRPRGHRRLPARSRPARHRAPAAHCGTAAAPGRRAST